MLFAVFASANKAENMSSTGSAPNWIIAIMGEAARIAPDKRRMVERLATVVSKTCCKVTTSDQAKNRRPRCTAMSGSTTNDSRNQP